MIKLQIPGEEPLVLEFLLLDVNGTLSNRGDLIEGVRERLSGLQALLKPLLLSADTFGSLEEIAAGLSIEARRAASSEEKVAVLHALGAGRCVAVGNGRNDAGILAEAALGIAVIGPEGASSEALAAADLTCRSVLEALDLLIEPRALIATLRS